MSKPNSKPRSTPTSPSRLVAAAAAGLAVALGSCLGPLVDDAPALGRHVLPADAVVPSLYDDPLVASRVDAHDGVDRVVRRVTAFASGQRVQYWSFGPAPALAVPIYALARRGEDGVLTPLPDHPSVVETIPGDGGYSPFWAVYYVPVTEQYAGERLTSLAAIDEARMMGLVEAPVRRPRVWNCPIVHPDVRLELAPDHLVAPSPVYYQGRVAALFSFERLEVPMDHDDVPVADVYLLRREGGEPLLEGARGVDMTGDGDTADTNNIFEVGLDDAGYTPLWRAVEVVVPADYKSIDSYGDDGQADFTSVTDLFTASDAGPSPVVGHVVAWKATAMTINCPIQPAQGPNAEPSP